MPGERRRQENLELACLAEPISSHKAYPRGLWLREVSVGSKLGRSQVLTEQVQTDQKGQQDLLSTGKATHGDPKWDRSNLTAWNSEDPTRVSVCLVCPILCAPFSRVVCQVSPPKCHKCLALNLSGPHTYLRCVGS